MTEASTYRIAFIIDGVVQDVVTTDARLAAIFLSQPTIIDVTDQPNSFIITVGSEYNQENNTFTESTLAQENAIEIPGVGPGNTIIDDSAENFDSVV